MRLLKRQAKQHRQYFNEAVYGKTDRITHLSVWERDINEEFPGLDLKGFQSYTGLPRDGKFLWVEWLRDGERCGASKYDIVQGYSGHGSFVEGLLNYPSYRQQAQELAEVAKGRDEPIIIVPFVTRKIFLPVISSDYFAPDLQWKTGLYRPDDLKEDHIIKIVLDSWTIGRRLSRPLANEIMVDQQLARHIDTPDKLVKYFKAARERVKGINTVAGITSNVMDIYQHRLSARKLGAHEGSDILYEAGVVIAEGLCLSQAQLAGMAGRKLKTVIANTEMDDEIIASVRNGGAKIKPKLMIRLENPKMRLSALFKKHGLPIPDKRHVLYADMMAHRQKMQDTVAGLKPIATEEEIYELLTRHSRPLREIKYRPPPNLLKSENS